MKRQSMKTRQVLERSVVVVIALLVMVTMVGCKSVGAVIKSTFSDLPYWYHNPEMGLSKDETPMLGQGSANTERQAELLAYDDIIGQLSDQVGYQLGREAYRELSVLGTILEFGLKVKNTYTAVEDGRYTVYKQVAINEKLLEQAMTEENKRRQTVSAEVKDIVLEGDEYVKDGKDLKAVSCYLRAMTLAYGQSYVNEDYGFDGLYPYVVEMIQSMRINIEEARMAYATCTVTLKRVGRFASSPIASAELMATYQAVDTRGEVYDDYFVYVTDDDGVVPFQSINDGLVRNGQIRFDLNIMEELDQLQAVVTETEDLTKVANLRALVNSKAAYFNYSKIFSMGSIAVAVIEHDQYGYVTGVSDISNYVTEKLQSDGAFATAFYPELDHEDEVLYEFQHSGRNENCLLVIRVGVIDNKTTDLGFSIANAEGIAFLYRRNSTEPLYSSDVINASAFAETPEEAAQGAFKNLADIAYTLIKAVYV